jgi:CBS domain-containing protein
VRYVVQRIGAIAEQSTGPGTAELLTAGSIMTRTPFCIREDVGVSAIADLLLERGFGAVPVVDADGRALGVVSKTDLLRHQHAGLPGDATATDIMMPMVFAVDQTTSLGDAAALMAGEGVHRLPVVDASGRVVGILSSLDLVRWLGQLAGYAL